MHSGVSEALTGDPGIDLSKSIDNFEFEFLKRQLQDLIQLAEENDYNFSRRVNETFLPLFLQYLRRSEFPQLQIETSRTLRYLGKNDILVLANFDTVHEFVNLLSSPYQDAQEEALMNLAIVAEKSTECLNERVLSMVLPHVNRPKAPFVFFEHAFFIVWSILRFKPTEQRTGLVESLQRLLEMEEEHTVLRDVCWAVFNVSLGGPESVQGIVRAGICPKLVELLFHSSPQILLPVMKTVAKIAEYGNYREVMDNRAFSQILSIISDDNNRMRDVQIEVCRTISSITAGTHHDLELLIQADLIPPLVGFLVAEAQIDIKKEAAYAICNAIFHGRVEQVEYLVDLGCIKLFTELITSENATLIEACLEALERMLHIIVGNNKHSYPFQNADIVVAISRLGGFEGSDNHHIFAQGVRIVSTYFSPDEDDHCFPSPAKKPRNGL